MDFAVRLSLLYAAIFGAVGVQMPFLPLWLTAKGLDAPAIGALLALGTAARMVALPLATRAADRWATPGTAIATAALAAAAIMTLLGLARGGAAIFLAYTLATAAWAVVLPLAESHALQGLPARGRAYGPVRLWGSAAFIVANLGAGWLTAMVADAQVIWIVVSAYWLVVGAALLLRPSDAGAAPLPRATVSRPRGTDRRLPLVLAASALIQASHSLLYGFSTLQWSAAGLSGLSIGALWAVGVLAEIVLFAWSARLPASISSPLPMLILGAAGGAVRWAGMALDPAPAWLPWLQGLHGLSFGAAHLGAVQFVARAAAPGRAASAQGSLAWVNGLAMAGATAASGLLYEAFGAAAYAAMAALAAAGGACALLAWRIGARSGAGTP
ncbi:MAG: MFS transporter [Variibacter sp.]|nr:MFS transporter [Variibacter sp.]